MHHMYVQHFARVAGVKTRASEDRATLVNR